MYLLGNTDRIFQQILLCQLISVWFRGIILLRWKPGFIDMKSIRKMEEQDRQNVLEMMRVFYASQAVFTNGSEEIFRTDIDQCIGENPYLEGFVIENQDTIIGYAMVAKSFSTEFGKPCIWIEDLYVKDEYRGLGIGSDFLRFVEAQYPHSLLRLEVEAENKRAVHVYKKCGYDVLPYMEMKKSI